jgi:hypothetical protein
MNPKIIQNKGYKSKNWATKIVGFLLILIIVPLFVGITWYNYGNEKAAQYNEIEPEKSPYPLLTLNESLLHVIVEGNLKTHGILGAEEREARYHSLVGYRHSVRFIQGKSPDDENNTLSNITCATPGSLGDAAFLNGLNLFGQAYRWAVYNRENNSAGILASESQIKRMLEGVYILTHVAGTPGELTRFAFPNNLVNYSSQVRNNRYYHGKICPSHSIYNPSYPNNLHNYPQMNFTGWTFSDDTSRDQNLGTLLGLSAVYKYCDNITLKNLAGERIIEIVDFLYNSNWFVHTNTDNNTGERWTNGADFDTGLFSSGWAKLSLLSIAKAVYPEKYTPIFNEYFVLHNQYLKLEGEQLTHHAMGSYYPLNLGWLTAWMFLQFLPKSDPFYSSVFQIMENSHYKVVKNHRNAWFQSLYLSFLSADELKVDNKARIILEVKDSLERMSTMRNKHFNGLWEQPFDEIGIDTSNATQMESLYDPHADKWFNDLEILRTESEELDDVIGYERLLTSALPINYRNMRDHPFQFNPFQLPAKNSRTRIEYFHSELTNVYWIARYLKIIGSPVDKFTPITFKQAEIPQYWPSLNFPAEYYTSDSVIEAYGIIMK